ncbi:hypothetical protein KAX02_02235 [candidate division WOR-3 bacterium]|nr:hypothetical protein [candidate division WOR-3 bacterium]MCK4328640.1 hypothetical protein [candidate division WOR-3 bacterium]
MVKYGMDVLFETEPFKTIRFSVMECDSPQEAEAYLKKWWNNKKALLDNTVNKRIIKTVTE